jgi:thioesterase domain-containing protein
MAAGHLAALQAVRPKGPYIIGGFCVGGLVAYELAQQIKATGEKVEMLLVIDAALEDKVLRALRSLAGAGGALFRWDDHAKVEHFGRWVLWRGRLLRWYGLNVQAQIRVVLRRTANRFFRVWDTLRPRFRREGTQSVKPTEGNAQGQRQHDMPSAFLWASAHYRPRAYDGAVALLLSDDVVHHGRNLAGEWKEIAPRVTVHPLPGSHLECITAHVDTLAQTIERCLQGVAANPPPRAAHPSNPCRSAAKSEAENDIQLSSR